MIPNMMNEVPIPAISDRFKNKNGLENYSVKYFKADMDDLSDVATLADIETRGLLGEEILLLNRDKYVFMQTYYVVLQYAERNPG